MNIEQINRLISGINLAIAGLSEASQAIAAAGAPLASDGAKVQEAFEIALAKPTAQPVTVSEPAPAPEPQAAKAIDIATVRAVLAELSQAGKAQVVRELINKAGASKLSEVDPSKYGWLLEQARQVSNA